MKCLTRILFFVPLALGWFSSPLAAADFSKITDAERQLTEVPGQPGAPAVVLFEKGELKLLDYPTEISSYLDVVVRLKILTEDGKEYGEVEIPHSAYYRLRDIEGRVTLPDGSVKVLDKESIFEERRSRSRKYFTTKLVFPAVEVGAIIDYKYEIRWDDLFYLEPWFFQSEIPKLHSEVTYIKPKNLSLTPWGIEIRNQPFQSETRKTPRGTAIRIWVENAPGIPDEDYSFPFVDMSSRFMMIPKSINTSGGPISLMESWDEATDYFIDSYKGFKRKDRKTKQRATQLVSGLPSTVEKVAALYAFVRDEIQTEFIPSVGGIDEDERADETLEARTGSLAEKALLLQAMLDAVKIDSNLIWAANRYDGRVDTSIPNPGWFETILLEVEIDGQPIYLDPGDRHSGFGHIAPYYENMPALRVLSKKPEVFTLPKSLHSENERRAKVQFDIDADGRATGGGSLLLFGHSARNFLRWKDTEEATVEAWTERLEESFEGFEISEVSVEENIRETAMRVSWTHAQREDDVLGDEVSLEVVGPLAIEQIFTLPQNLRRTPVLLSYGRSEQLQVDITWGQDWIVDIGLDDVSYEGPEGRFERRTEESDGKLTIRRTFERPEYEYVNPQSYGALRTLYEEASKADAQSVVLVLE